VFLLRRNKLAEKRGRRENLEREMMTVKKTSFSHLPLLNDLFLSENM